MSGIKGVIKYISQLLILSSFSIIFLPIICLKCYEEKSEISIFKFMQWSIGKSTKSFLDADMEFVIGRQMKIYIVCALIWVMVTVIFTIIILLVQSQLSYYIAIVAQLFTILSGGLIYLMLRMETKGPILEKISNSSADGTAAGYNPEMTPGYTPTLQQNHKKTGIIAIVAIVAAVLIAVAVIFSIFHAVKGRSPEKTVDQLVTSLFKLDADGIIDTFPKEAVNKLKKEGNWDDEYDDLVSGIESIAQSVGDYVDLEELCSYKITETKDATKEEIAEIQEDYDDEGIDVKIKDAKIITVELTINIPIYGSETDSEDFVVIKIGNSWYIDPMNFSL